MLTHYFSLPKGGDIRMVYNGTSSGLKYALQAPHFALTMVKTTLRSIEQVTCMANRDIGKIFLNFMLSKEVRPYLGADIRNGRKEEVWERSILRRWQRCERKLIVLNNLSCHACQVVTWAKELALRNIRYKKDPFQWEKVVNNLPGKFMYDCCWPCVYKERSDGSIFADIFLYVDDE